MSTVRLGKAEIISPKNAFGALPIQRISVEDSTRLIRECLKCGKCASKCPYGLDTPCPPGEAPCRVRGRSG